MSLLEYVTARVLDGEKGYGKKRPSINQLTVTTQYSIILM